MKKNYCDTNGRCRANTPEDEIQCKYYEERAVFGENFCIWMIEKWTNGNGGQHIDSFCESVRARKDAGCYD